MKKKQTVQAVITAGAAISLAVLALSQKTSIGQEYYVVSVNGTQAGAIAKSETIDEIVRESKRAVMRQTDGYAYLNIDVAIENASKKGVYLSNKEELQKNLASLYTQQQLSNGVQAYTVTSGKYSGNFASEEEAQNFLVQVKDKTEGGNTFSLNFESDAAMGRDVRKVQIKDADAWTADAKQAALSEEHDSSLYAGAAQRIFLALLPQKDEDENYLNQTGILAMDFADNVHIYDNFVKRESLNIAAKAAEEVTKEKETNKIYVVEAGDCLSTIAEKFDTTVDSIVGLNELGSAEAVVYSDQEMIVAVPKPDISFLLSVGSVYEEEYTAEPDIIAKDSWYTTQENVLQEGASGQREVNAVITYEQGLEISREIVNTRTIREAVPAIVERGTQIPPTYMKPISGGRFTSGFKKRWGKMHKGLDWSVSIGTPVSASSAGTVSVAGAVRGYGYAVYISHPDGRQTRYGHLSKVLVSPGQTVNQGDTIALSGNTGRSTGPHVHFEILIDGTQVNPLEYMN